ncbi:MAG: diadenylate cyclase CdaA [bacterium]|nr:diadenylate cyclase CdaA [bacterium]
MLSNALLQHYINYSWQAVAVLFDILLVSTLIYKVLLFVRGTRALPMLAGLGMLLLVYWLSSELGFLALNWILGNFLGSVILVVVVLFQDDLRRGLIKVGLMRRFAQNSGNGQEQTLREVATAASELSRKKTGALIVIQRDIGLNEYTEHAVKLDSLVSHQILISIFNTSSPLHDGAVIINGSRLLVAGSVLPLTFSSTVSAKYGTRHRAAIGLSERTDALAVVVSEETGGISLVREGKITKGLTEKTLLVTLRSLIVLRKPGKNLARAQESTVSETEVRTVPVVNTTETVTGGDGVS